MGTVFTMITKGLGAKSQTEELAFAGNTPREYAMMLLEQAGITNIERLNKVFIEDPGVEVAVRDRSFGRGLEFKDATLSAEATQRNKWLLFERMPGEGANDYLRARLFNSFEGAAAEFAVKLRLHPHGDVKVAESQSTPGTWQLSFSGGGRQMVMAPMDVGLEAASATR